MKEKRCQGYGQCWSLYLKTFSRLSQHRVSGLCFPSKFECSHYSGDTDIYIDIPITFMSVSGPPGTLFSTFSVLPASRTATPEQMAAMTPLL